ncbi:DUF7286 family protein [Haloplanus salilacus]|uniref:DUF7286 family protein n=1 Tax=Haloplanus salilacus TaxID=2949994 RepID=UPI0030D047B6
MTRFAEDRRARVPFALVGVLLLVGASTFAAVVDTRGPDRIDRDADVAMERVEAATTETIRSAVGEASRAAATEPVTEPAATPYGRLLSDARPFRDALRLRIYLSLDDRLETTRYRRGDVTAVASLPEATTPAELGRAMDRIEVKGVGNGTAVRVTVRNVTVSARDDGRLVAREHRTRTVTVATPVLALHDRTATFETRLNRTPLDGPGLGRRLTARLYPIAWARGYAQYGGVPIANVVATRHVETSTNAALLTAQRSAFGRSDPAGRRATRRATLELGVRDLTAATEADSSWADRVVPRPNERRNASGNTSVELPIRGRDGPSPSHRIDVDTGVAPDRAATGLRTEAVRSNRSLDGLFRSAYRVEAELLTSSRQTYDEPRPEPNTPGEEWSLETTDVTMSAEVDASSAPAPDSGSERHRFETFTRHVTLDRTVAWTWRRGNRTITTDGEWTERYRVGVAVVGEYAPNGTAPDRPTRQTFERGGPVGGPNLADVPGKAERRLVDEQGGRDDVAVAVANDSLGVHERTVYGDRPSALRSWVNADLAELRGRLSNASVGVDAGRIATYTANPPERLADDLRKRRMALIEPPDRYRGAADRARVAARAALVDATIRRLERRADGHEERRRAFDRVLGHAGIESPRSLRRTLDAGRRSAGPANASLAREGTPPTGPVSVVPDGSPAYLTVASVSHDRAVGVPPSRSYHPLSSENVNLFVAPYGDAADSVAGSGSNGSSRTRLRTAAQALNAADGVENASIREPRSDLRSAVSGSVATLRAGSRHTVRSETQLSRPSVREAVTAGFDRWESPADRALAASNGSLARAIAVEADERASGADPARVDRIEARLETTFGRTLATRAGTVAQERVNATVTRVRERAMTDAADAATDRLLTDRLNGTLGAVPAGLPVAPVPGYWYATINVWSVSVRGAYARFSLRTRRGGPTPGGTLRYVRDGSTVRLDVDGDGDGERLGRDERVDFETRTAVAVAVPAGRDGVGDVDGEREERAGTWPRPGCTSWAATACRDGE